MLGETVERSFEQGTGQVLPSWLDTLRDAEWLVPNPSCALEFRW